MGSKNLLWGGGEREEEEEAEAYKNWIMRVVFACASLSHSTLSTTLGLKEGGRGGRCLAFFGVASTYIVP